MWEDKKQNVDYTAVTWFRMEDIAAQHITDAVDTHSNALCIRYADIKSLTCGMSNEMATNSHNEYEFPTIDPLMCRVHGRVAGSGQRAYLASTMYGSSVHKHNFIARVE